MNERQIDRTLIAVAKRDCGALEKLYAETKNGVYAFLYPYFGNRADTEDCLQDVYLKVSAHACGYRAGTNGRAWLLQIAKNTAIDQVRKKNRVMYTDSPPEKAGYGDGGETPVFDAVQTALNEEERKIVILHVLWGYKHREIAEMTDTPVGTVTAKYKRALEKVKKYLKEADE